MRERLDRYLLDLRLVFDAIDATAFEAMAERLAARPRFFVGGLGRTGAVMGAFAARLAQSGHVVHVVLELGTPDFEEGDLLLLGSGSGATRTLGAVAQEARNRGVEILLVTGNMLGPLVRESVQSLYLPPTIPGAGAKEGAVQPGQTAFEQALLLVLDALAEDLEERRRSGSPRTP